MQGLGSGETGRGSLERALLASVPRLCLGQIGCAQIVP